MNKSRQRPTEWCYAWSYTSTMEGTGAKSSDCGNCAVTRKLRIPISHERTQENILIYNKSTPLTFPTLHLNHGNPIVKAYRLHGNQTWPCKTGMLISTDTVHRTMGRISCRPNINPNPQSAGYKATYPWAVPWSASKAGSWSAFRPAVE